MTSISESTREPLRFTPTVADGLPPALDRRQLIFTRLRQTAAMSAGLEAMAVRAIDAGEATPDQLDQIADLAGHLTEQLSNLSALFVEMTGGNQQ